MSTCLTRHWPWPLLLLALVTLGCSGSTPAAPALVPDETPAATIDRAGALTQAIGGRWRLEVDGAQVSLDPIRAASTADQGRLFHLDIGQFMRAKDLEIRSFEYDVDGNLRVDYAIHHPFPPPVFANPPNAKNRADLSFSGQLLILTDVPSGQTGVHTFYPGIVANTEAVLDADGFVDPGDLLYRDPTIRATVFPYKLVVDELRNNREGRSNDGSITGNFDQALGGWQRVNMDEFGINNGWTGYDVLHQGQTATGSFTLSQSALAAGRLSTELAVLIKYQDPKGTVPILNPLVRFPQDQPADLNVFAYHPLFGAIDASVVTVGAIEGFLSTGGGTMSTIEVAVRDWDALAPETGEPNVGEDPNLLTIQGNASGKPVVEASVPALSDTVFLSQVFAVGDGKPGNELQYQVTIANDKGTAPAGPVAGLLRVTDPEHLLSNRNLYTFGVDPDTLAADPARMLDAITYQRIALTLAPSTGFADNLPGEYINADTAATYANFDPTQTSITSGMAANGTTVYHLSLNRTTPLPKLALNVSIDAGENWTGAQDTFTLTSPGPYHDGAIAVVANGDLVLLVRDGEDAFAIHGRADAAGVVQWKSNFAMINPDHMIVKDISLYAHPNDATKVYIAIGVEDPTLGPGVFDLYVNETTLSETDLAPEWWQEMESVIGERFFGLEFIHPQVAVSSNGAMHSAFLQGDSIFYTAKQPGGDWQVQPDIVETDPTNASIRPKALTASSIGVPYLLYVQETGAETFEYDASFVARRQPPPSTAWDKYELDPIPVDGNTASDMKLDPDTGAVYLTWEREDIAGHSRIMYLVLPPDLGTPIIGPQAVSPDPSTNSSNPFVAFSRDGGTPYAVVLYEGGDTPQSHEVSAIRIVGD